MLRDYNRRVQCSLQAQVTMQMSQLSSRVETVNIHETYCENISFLTAANKSKVYYGIPPEPDLWVVLKEENEKEYKNKPKVSTFWKYGVVFNLVREVCSVALVLPYYVFQINYLTWEWKLPMLCLFTLSLSRSYYSFSLL